MKTLLLCSLLCLGLSIISVEAQDIRITEFMASNTSGIQDEDATYQGWIEIWNPSTTTGYSLENWALTDGTSTWVFPAVTLSQGDRMLIWASGKNRKVVTAPLHTNFILNKAGGILKLLRPDTSVASAFDPYPVQKNNNSYGADFKEPALIGTYTTATPNDVNNFSGSGVAGKVNFSVSSVTFSAPFTVSLTQASPVASGTIRYTTDNTEPLSSSTAYTGPITVAATTQIRARVFTPGLLPGQIASNCYLLLDTSTKDFTSTMPIVVMTDFNYGTPVDGSGKIVDGTPTEPVYNTGYMWVFQTGTDGIARLSSTPSLVTRIGMHRHGSTTLGNAKYNLKVETRRDRDDEDSNVALLNMPEDSDWIFSGPYDVDRSLLHNPLISAMSFAVGRYAPRSVQAEVFIDVKGGALHLNDSGNFNNSSNDYYGVYNVEESIRRGENRVEVVKVGDVLSDPTASTGGYIFKVDRLDTGEVGFSAPHMGSLCYVYPKERDMLAPQNAVRKNAFLTSLNTVDAAIYSGTYTNPVTGYRKYIDVPAAIDFHLLNTWAFNVDGLRLSTYLYRDQGGKVVFAPIWDFDRSLSSNDDRDDNPEVWSIAGATDFFSYAWWSQFFKDIDFYQQYIDRWQELRAGAYSQANINTMIDQLNATISSAAVARDLARWNKAKRDWTSPFDSTYYPASQAAEIQRLKDYMQQRANFFDTYFVPPVAPDIAGGNVSAGTQVTLSSTSTATIYYTLNGTDPRPSGGAVPSGTGVFVYNGTPITINSTQRVKARAYVPTWSSPVGTNNPRLVSKWSGLTNVRYSTDTPAYPGSLSVTEVNYHPANATVAELAVNPHFTDDDFEFIELKNVSSNTLDLGNIAFTGGIYMTFSGSNAISLAPGAFALVVSNRDGFVARYGSAANIVGPYTDNLSNSSERVTLVSASGATLADFTYMDSWYPTTDGGGHSLAVYNPLAPSSDFSTAANWRASASIASPGANEPNLAPLLTLTGSATTNLPGLTLAGTVSDDQLPNGTLTYTWARVGGPGSVTFASPTSASSEIIFGAPGVYTLSLTVSDGSLSASKNVSVTALDTPEAWLGRNPGIGSLSDNPAGDGVNNFTKWALLLDPAANTPSPVPVVLENGALTLTYSRQKNTAVTYTVQISTNLVDWRSPNPGEVIETILNDAGGSQTVKVTDTVKGASHRFLRLMITSQ